MATLGTNWPVRPVYQSDTAVLQQQYFNEHFLTNPNPANPAWGSQQSNAFLFNSNRSHIEDEGMHSPKSPSTPRFTSHHTSSKTPPLFSPTPTWHQLRVPAWLERHDHPTFSEQQASTKQTESPPQQQDQRHEQPARFRHWLDARKRSQEAKTTRGIHLLEGKRQARAQRIAEAKVRNREKKERWKALARKAEGSGEDCVIED
ncbi:unnamed protein product [Zymoseptoria tritici ST99CH_1E4]|uniref:Uncharacterized protein n=1 Tax=Zymoseptoria tritici ST99CH_1E4 TaxID=1276532 RepID=A0A2H1G562_ZYMTR|nr:unnamed protein product [Zymoseptoria tritici ST99CH_1E4]